MCEGGSLVEEEVLHDDEIESAEKMCIRDSNCTGAAHKVDLTEYGKVVCLVADPLVRQITLQAGQTKRVRTVYKAPPCTGSGSIVANLTSSEGKELATRTARFRIVAPPAAT